MTYIDYMNAFTRWIEQNSPTAGQISLFYALLAESNRMRWESPFVTNLNRLAVLSGMSVNGVRKAREALRNDGLITYETIGKNSTSYTILLKDSKSNNLSSNNSSNSCNFGCYSVATGVASHNKDIDKDIIIISHNNNFERFWDEHPKSDHKDGTRKLYCGLLEKGYSEESLIKAAKNYREAADMLSKPYRFLNNSLIFLKDSVFVNYLPENYKRPQKQTKHKSSMERYNEGIMKNTYDFDDLEKKLLGM